MGSSRSYRDLVAWQKAVDLAVAVYDATRCFPREEIYGLTNQLRRAAVSVPSNIAEGQGRGTPAEFLHFTRIAMGSLQEMETQIIISGRLTYLLQTDIDALLERSEEVGRVTRGLQKSLR